MASLEVLSVQNGSGSHEFNDYSLLAEVETLGDAAQKKDSNQPNNDNFNFTNMQSALTSGTLPDSSTGIHSHMNELIQENNRLKEMLNKNNSVLEDFKNAKERVSSLENENSELRKKLIDMEQEVAQGPKSCTKCTTLDTGLKHMLGMDYIEENQVLLMEWSYFRENLFGNLTYVCQQLEEIARSKKTCEEKLLLNAYALMLKFKIAFIGEYGDNAQFASLRTDEETGFEVVRLKAREEDPFLAEDLKKIIIDKDRELSSLKKEKEEYIKKLEEYELKVHEYETALKFQSELLHHELQAVQSNTPVPLEGSADSVHCDGCLPDADPHVVKSLIKQWKEQIKKYELKLEENSKGMPKDQVLEELQVEIRSLKEQLELEQQKHKEKLAEITTKCENLQVDYDRLTKILEIQSRDEKKKDLMLKEMQAERKWFLEESDLLNAKLISAEEELAQKHADAQEPNRKLYSPRYRGKSSDQRNQTGKESTPILCPICNKGFADERSAQEHVNKCLEEN